MRNYCPINGVHFSLPGRVFISTFCIFSFLWADTGHRAGSLHSLLLALGPDLVEVAFDNHQFAGKEAGNITHILFKQGSETLFYVVDR